MIDERPSIGVGKAREPADRASQITFRAAHIRVLGEQLCGEIRHHVVTLTACGVDSRQAEGASLASKDDLRTSPYVA